MMRLEVEEFEDIKSGYRIKFHFGENPYFENSLIIKEFHLGTGVFGSSLANLLCPVSVTPQVLKDDMWPNPLQYFLIAESESGENGLDDSDEENGDDSVVIVDEDEDEDNEDEDDDVQEIVDEDDDDEDDG
ncbi:hypothetical protein chiPu_0021490 [Chiloscyllium punctatum]|uniref:Uncharacterized protein n=1 Tax=Chiloscyllium punctatum TaxID=137246 RepID=A0A401RG46_CHIPU|nr:hypothetical protein [Chiloscyllium punctatum]